MANLLDLFAIGFSSEGLREFETNLKNTERELDKAEKEVTSLEKKLLELEKAEKRDEKAILSVKVALNQANDNVKKFGDSLKVMQGRSEYQLLNLKKNFGNLTKTLGMLATVGVAVKKSLDFYEQAEQLDFLAQKSGIAADKLQTLGNAAKRYGGTTEGAAGTVENLRSQYQSLRMGQGGSGLEQAAFQYGVAISSDPEKMLENVAKRMETLKSDAAKWDLAKTLGIDEGTTRLLIQGVDTYRKELERANKYKLYTKEDIARMREYRQIQGDIRMGLESVFGTIWRGLLPAITTVARAVRGVTDWLAEHEGATKIIATLLTLTAIIGGVTAAVTLFNMSLEFLAANPVILTIFGIVAAVTLLIAVVQDFVAFMQGGDSIIGRIYERLGINTDRLRKNIKNFFGSFKDGITGAIDWLKSLGGKFSELGQKLKELWDKIPDPLKKIIGLTANPITAAYTVATTGKEIIEKYNNNPMNGVSAGAVANYNQTEALNQTNTQNTKNITQSNSSRKTVNIKEVNIQTQARDPQRVANIVRAMSGMDPGYQS